MEYLKRLLLLIFFSVNVALINGCAPTTYFKEAQTDEPHAVLLMAVHTKGMQGALGELRVRPLDINGLPPNEWNRWRLREFRIHSGEINIIVKANIYGPITSFSQLKFNAKAGETYTVDTNVEIDRVDFFVTNSEGTIVTKAKSMKQPEVDVPTYTPKYAPQM